MKAVEGIKSHPTQNFLTLDEFHPGLCFCLDPRLFQTDQWSKVKELLKKHVMRPCFGRKTMR